jgi:AsmA-like C-terminal region
VSRLTRGALVAAGVALVAVAALGTAGYVASRHSDRLLAAAGRALGRDVRAERLGFTLRGGVGVVLAGVAIADDPALGTSEPFLAARALDLRLRILPLFRRELVVDRIVVEEPVVNLVRDASGRLNVDSLRKKGKDAGDAGAPGAPAARQAFQLVSLRLRDGTVRYRDAASGRTVALTDVAIDARQPRFDGPVPISIRAQLATEDLRLDGIVSEGVLDLGADRPSYRGTLHASGMIGQIAVDRLTADIHAAPPIIDLESARVETLGGPVTGSAHVSSGDEHASLTARLDATGIDLARLPARADRPRPAGTLELHGTLTGPPAAAGFKAGATGEGQFAVANGRIQGAGLGRAVFDTLQPFLKPGVADRLRQRYPDLLGSDDLRFTKLSGSGRLAEGRIRSDDFVLAAPSYDAHGEGSLGLDGDVDATVRLAAGPALTDDILGKSQARAALVDARGQLAVPLRVRGPLDHPHVTPDPSFAATAAGALLGGTGLGEAAGSLLERLLGGKHHAGH